MDSSDETDLACLLRAVAFLRVSVPFIGYSFFVVQLGAVGREFVSPPPLYIHSIVPGTPGCQAISSFNLSKFLRSHLNFHKYC